MFDIPGINTFFAMSDDERLQYDEEVAAKIEEQERKEKLIQFKKCGIGERFMQESFDTYLPRNEETEMAKKIVMDFVSQIKTGTFRSLKLLGAVGNGKTHLAAAILRDFGGTYRKAAEIVSEYQASKSFSANLREKDLIEIYGNSRLLVIDEIGRSNNEKDEKYMLYAILNARYENKRPSVLISNFGNREFASFTGEAVTDRFNEQAITIEFKGESYRIDKRE